MFHKLLNCILSDVLFVPDLSFNLLSVPKAAKSGKCTEFLANKCKIYDEYRNLIVVGNEYGDLYYLQCKYDYHINTVMKPNVKTKENVWHGRYGHLGIDNLRLLAKKNLVDGFDFDVTKDLNFCEPCVKGKTHRSSFPHNTDKVVREPFDLIHSDVCGKINEKSLGNGEYFLTFIDDSTRYVSVYILKRKDEVFQKFVE